MYHVGLYWGFFSYSPYRESTVDLASFGNGRDRCLCIGGGRRRMVFPNCVEGGYFFSLKGLRCCILSRGRVHGTYMHGGAYFYLCYYCCYLLCPDDEGVLRAKPQSNGNKK